MTRKVLFVELTVFERMTPLATGYLQAYAMEDSFLRSEYHFERYTDSAKTASRDDVPVTWSRRPPTSTRSAA